MYRIIFILCIVCGGLSSKLWAQDYETAFSLYLQNEFASAEGIVQNLLAENMPAKNRAKLLKLLGLTQYMQGARSESADSFRKAKKLNPATRLLSTEVLDPSVLDFFNSIEAPRSGPGETIYEEAPAPKKQQKEPVFEPVEEKKVEPTNLIIFANINDAKVIVDGFFRGKVGDFIPIDPGYHSVEVYANGYQNQVQSLFIQGQMLNKFSFELVKLSDIKKKEEAPKEKEKKEDPSNLAKKKAPKKKKKRTPDYIKHAQEEMSEGIYFIPFGVPQYVQGKVWLGLGFSILQGAGLGYTIAKAMEVSRVTEDTNSTVSNRNVEETRITDPAQKKAFADETDRYYEGQLNTINDLRTQAYIGASVFVLSWLASGIEAYYNPPGPTLALNSKEWKEWKERKDRESVFSWSLNPTYLPPFQNKSGLFALNFAMHF